jgi:sulfofructose kinase
MGDTARPLEDPTGDDRCRVVCLGDISIERIFRVDAIPDRPIKVQARAYRERCGGLAALAARAIVALGHAASLHGRLGDDADGARILARLAQAGIDADGVRRIPGARTAGTATIEDPAGRRLRALVGGSGLAGGSSGIQADACARVGAVLVDARWPQDALALLDAARARRVPGVLAADAGEPAAIAALAPLAGHVICSAATLARVAGTADPLAGLLALAKSGAGSVATLGGGSIAWVADGALRRVATRMPDGGYGALCGAYALAVGRGDPPETAMRFAADAALPAEADAG